MVAVPVGPLQCNLELSFVWVAGLVDLLSDQTIDLAKQFGELDLDGEFSATV